MCVHCVCTADGSVDPLCRSAQINCCDAHFNGNNRQIRIWMNETKLKKSEPSIGMNSALKEKPIIYKCSQFIIVHSIIYDSDRNVCAWLVANR